MYITRSIENQFLKLLDHFPAVAILGPRQVGKTTLVNEIKRNLKQECVSLDLENPMDLAALDHPLEFFYSVRDKTVIIDEIQRKPELFPALRVAIDNYRINGRFILLGSASQELLFMSNETLAGRIVYLELTPISFKEIKHLNDFRHHWLKGGYPVPFLLDQDDMRREWFKAFILAYVERDLRLLGLGTSSSEVFRLLQMLAGIHGNLLNVSSLANSMGLSAGTVRNILSYFERSFIIRLLPPWYTNNGKRLVKSPKVYFQDSGIINYLSGITTYEQLIRHPNLGNLWEGYVIEDIIHTLGNKYSFYFYRTADGTECDLLVFDGLSCKAAIDVKFTATPGKSRSMTISIQNVNPEAAYFVVPDCPAPYKISEKIWVITPAQLIEKLDANESASGGISTIG